MWGQKVASGGSECSAPLGRTWTTARWRGSCLCPGGPPSTRGRGEQKRREKKVALRLDVDHGGWISPQVRGQVSYGGSIEGHEERKEQGGEGQRGAGGKQSKGVACKVLPACFSLCWNLEENQHLGPWRCGGVRGCGVFWLQLPPSHQNRLRNFSSSWQ